MAISKTQNERPAIVSLIDAVNMSEPIVAQNVQNIATLTDGLADEISNRENADTDIQSQLDVEISNRENADTDIQNQIGAGMFSPSFTITQGFQRTGLVLDDISNDVSVLNAWKNRFRLGLTPNLSVAAGGSTSGTLDFEEPFDSGADVAVFPVCIKNDTTLADLACKVTFANYSGFTFEVFNTSQADATVKVGFLAVRMN